MKEVSRADGALLRELPTGTGSDTRESQVGHTGPHPFTPRYVWYVIVLLAAVSAVNYMDRMALAVLMPAIKADLQLSDGRLGFLVGLAFSIFYAVCGIPIARWADRGIRKNIIALALTTWSVMTSLSGAAQNFWHLLIARIGVGAGEAGCLPPAQSIICDYVPLKRRAGALAAHNFGLYAGMMLGMGLTGWLAELIGWRWAFFVLGLPGIVLAAIVHFTLREPARGYFDGRKEPAAGASFEETLTALWRCKTYRRLMVFLTLNGFVQYGLTQWLPSFYSRLFGMSLSSLGMQLGIAIGVGSAIGLLIGGLAANKAAERDIMRPLRLSAVATALTVPTSVSLLLTSSETRSILLVSLTALLWSVVNGPVLSSVYSVVTARMRAVAGAVTIFFTSVLGFGLGPFCVGLLSDLLTPSLGEEALRYAMLAPTCLLPLMALALSAAAKTLAGDLQTVGARV